MPVTPDFATTYQWVRELRRFKSGNMLHGVYFRVEDGEQVYMGHYMRAAVPMSVNSAHAEILNNPGHGLQVLLTRRIATKEILRIKQLPQLVGWRYYPEAKTRKPCGCPICQRGEFGARKLRDAYERE
jgi:hypothetical protein